MGRNKISLSQYLQLASNAGIVLIGDIPDRIVDKAKWKCSKGHEWNASYHSINKGTRCPHCSNHVSKTLTDYESLARQIGYTLKDKNLPRTTHHKTTWICKNNHEWIATYRDIKNGNRCPFCSNRFKKAAINYQNLAKSKNLKWLGVKVMNTHTKTLWQCIQGHEFQASYDKIRGGGYCPECVGKRRKIKQDYIAISKEKGFKWLESDAPPAHKKTKWQCANKHYFEASLKSINNGSGCPYCAGLDKKQIHHYHILANEKGYTWVGGHLPKNVTTKTDWQCRNGHVFKSTYNYIQSGNGCKICSGLEKKTQKDYHNLAKKRNIEWVGIDIVNVMTKTSWKCENGHVWSATYDSIRTGTSCPECQNIINGARISKIQREICKQVQGKLNFRFNKYTIDIALFDNDLKVAIEYDCWYWHGNRIEFDKDRDAYLIQNGWKVIRIKTRNKKPSNHELHNAVEKIRNGQDYAEIILDDWGQGNTFISSKLKEIE
jgi:very-short-patch-repair endonuclease